MGSISDTCEIIESKEELNLVRHFERRNKTKSAFGMNDRDRKLPMLKVGHNDYLKDDLNPLFEAIYQKAASRSLDLSQVSADSLRKSALKKPMGVGVSYSPRSEISEAVTIKKALRGLSISHASEMAAMKRLPNSAASPRVSEAGRIKSLYRSVVVESNGSSPSLNEGKDSMREIRLVPEESSSSSSGKIPQYLQEARIKSSNQSTQSSPRLAAATTPKVKGTTSIRNEINPVSTEVGKQTSKTEVEKHVSLPSLSYPNSGENKLQPNKEVPESTKLAKKTSASKPGRKGKLQTVSTSSSINGGRVNKLMRNNTRLVKPVFRKRNFVKKKSKQDSGSVACTPSTYNDVNGDVDPGKSQLICQRCQCSLKNDRTESNQGSSVSKSTKLGAEVGSGDVNTGASKPTSIANSCVRSSAVITKANKNSKLREKGEFSQSSKSSLGEYSTSTSVSEESNLSRSSCSNRPHMSKDARWEAIRRVRMQHGILGLRHFNLLKKLGCGDIGTVYLAELIGANCLFAIKVMDNEYLDRRKKMPRAQTEREILRMLDHPFLPTLYSQFTSDNLSCLVMEYCPGGDLHVLRQKQPGRNFPEQAARFYVAEVLLALEYLHMLGVVYRDLKPENILVREDGHIMLTDFDLSLRCSVSPTLLKSSSSAVIEPARASGPCTGSSCIDPFCIEPPCQVRCFSPRLLPAAAKARKVKSDHAALLRSLPQLVAEPTDARSNSFVGTHEYLAPEIIKGEGHGSAVDWWTFGIFLYELLYGKTPFKGSGNEETLANVVVQSLKFPDSPLVSFQARDLIRELLVKEPENRLGTERGAAEIKQHPFFEGLNWALIRCAVPPELPEIYDYGVLGMAPQEKNNKYLEYRATGDHLEFELF